MKTLIKTLLSLFALSLATPLYATTITGNGLPSAHTSLFNGTVIDFESAAPGLTTQLTYPEVTMTPSMGVSGQLSVEDLTGFNTTGQHISLRRQEEAQAIRFDFLTPVNALGMNIGGTNKNWLLTAYSAANAVLDTHAIPLNDPSDDQAWYGIVAANITYATLVNTEFAQLPSSSTQDYITIDNLTYSRVPAPAPLALLAIGLLAVGFSHRIKH